MHSGQTVVNRTLFERNRSSGYGAAVYSEIHDWTNSNNPTIFDSCTFQNNTSQKEGGAIVVKGGFSDSVPVNIYNSIIRYNTAEMGGGIVCYGAVSDWSKTVIIDNTSPTDNSSQYYCDSACESSYCSFCGCSSCQDCGDSSSCAYESSSSNCVCLSQPYCQGDQKSVHMFCFKTKLEFVGNSYCQMKDEKKTCICEIGWSGENCSRNENVYTLLITMVVIGSVLCFYLIFMVTLFVVRRYKKRKGYHEIDGQLN